MERKRIIIIWLIITLIFASPIYGSEKKEAKYRTVRIDKTTANVNVREGPDIGSRIIDTVQKGTLIKCLPQVKGGWRKISYGGREAYICNAYLKFDHVQRSGNTVDWEAGKLQNTDVSPWKTLAKKYSNYGTYGRLIVPRVGIDVASTYCGYSAGGSYDTDLTQEVTNRQDSAACFYFNSDRTLIFADHKNQGFDGLYSVKTGDKAYILKSDGSCKALKCVRTCAHGQNAEYNLLDDNGMDIDRMGYDVVMYTCNPVGWWDITVTFWNYTEDQTMYNVSLGLRQTDR